jgi:hypothetical protein
MKFSQDTYLFPIYVWKVYKQVVLKFDFFTEHEWPVFSFPGAHKTKHYTIYITTFTDYKTIAATRQRYRVNTVNAGDGGGGEGGLELYFLRDDIFKQTNTKILFV